MSSGRAKIRVPSEDHVTSISRRDLVSISFRTFLAGSAAASGVTSLAGMPKAEAAPASSSRLDRIVKTGKLRVGQFLSYKPYGFKNTNGEPDGFDVDLTKMVAADMGVQPEF